MAKKKASDELAVGTRVRVRAGTPMPEFPDVVCDGWTGTVVEVTGKKPNTKCVIEWDEHTLSIMPQAYLQSCEAQGLYHRMACLESTSLELAN